MTKKHPERLCKECENFDYVMNRKDGISFDVLVVCDHDEDVNECKKDYSKDRKLECRENAKNAVNTA